MEGPLIIQSDKTILLETNHPLAEQARSEIASFAELERAPEHIHTYRITPLALWNARAAGIDSEQVVDVLLRHARYTPAQSLLIDIVDVMARYGKLQLTKHPDGSLILTSSSPAVFLEVTRHKKIAPLITAIHDDVTAIIPHSERGNIKQQLIKVGWPAEDLAGYVDGQKHPISLKEESWTLRPYQKIAADSFTHGGSGVIVMPCGSGKTIVGAAAMANTGATTLILVTNTISARQWRTELLNRTNLTPAEIGEYSGQRKEIKPVTIATYSIITRKSKGIFTHLELFNARDWGLIIYDEVHLLPAPVFRLTADLQSRRRLGLTATLVREDGMETDVFSLIGPKRFDVPWKEMENQGWIAPATCIEVRVCLQEDNRLAYAIAEPEERYHLSAASPEKTAAITAIINRHPGEQILIIGAFIDQLEKLSQQLNCPVLHGGTKLADREKLFDQFRQGEITTLIVSKVANFSIDLPEAAVVIQISGTFGSRQEEAQRLGRVLRPKKDARQAYFYSVVSRDTVDADYAAHRQRFLAEQGYAYTIMDSADLY